MQKYRDLQSLISQDADARQYYNNLPEYIREMLGTRGDNVTSWDSLKRNAENLLIGD